jgi:uncharacterized protein YbjT (DUF2867 family)
MKIVLTGATGFVGSAIARYLVANGHELKLPLRRPQLASSFDQRASCRDRRPTGVSELSLNVGTI